MLNKIAAYPRSAFPALGHLVPIGKQRGCAFAGFLRHNFLLTGSAKTVCRALMYLSDMPLVVWPSIA